MVFPRGKGTVSLSPPVLDINFFLLLEKHKYVWSDILELPAYFWTLKSSLVYFYAAREPSSNNP